MTKEQEVYKEISVLVAQAKELLEKASKLAKDNDTDFSFTPRDSDYSLYYDPEMDGWYSSY